MAVFVVFILCLGSYITRPTLYWGGYWGGYVRDILILLTVCYIRVALFSKAPDLVMKITLQDTVCTVIFKSLIFCGWKGCL